MTTDNLTKLVLPVAPANTAANNVFLPITQSVMTPYTNPWALSPAERDIEPSFIRALQLLHSTDPESKLELKKLVENQLQQSTHNIPTSAKMKIGLDAKKLIHPVITYASTTNDSNTSNTKGNLKDKLGRQPSQVNYSGS